MLVSDQYGIGTWTQLANSGSTGYWKLIGNTGTTIGSGNFLGTIDNSDFLIKANNQYKILVSAATSNLTLFGDTNFGRGGGNQ